jgi:PLP dependent protein
MKIAENIKKLQDKTPSNVKLVAVSKTKPNEDILAAYECGHLDFGENKVQELKDKAPALPEDIRWHYIGHLQTNKVKYIASFVHLIHAVDSLKLLKEINKQAKKHQRCIPYLLQFHIAEEETKFGLDMQEAKEIIEAEVFPQLENISCVGVMGMATYTDNKAQIKKEFSHLKRIFQELKNTNFADKDSFKEISMGMTNDYTIAIEEGSTILRIGSLIFGERNTH